MSFQKDKAKLAMDYGIHFHGHSPVDYLNRDIGLATDAQPSPVTASNSGIPAYLVNYVDPEVVRVLVTPMRFGEIFGEQKKGDWTTATAQFPVAEAVGDVETYGDYQNGGNATANFNWVPRQSYHYQTVTQWGELELERMGTARIDYAAQLNAASALALNKAGNRIYAFGVEGLENYGALNDPSLPAPITPAATGTGDSMLWDDKDGAGIYNDIQRLYAQLQRQMRGYIDRSTPMTLALSPVAETNLTKTNQYNVNVSDQLSKNFPNLRIETAVEYETESGELVQLIANQIDGQQTAYAAFTEKMRAHPVKIELSSFKQKKSAGNWGTVIRRPLAVASMQGV